MLVGALAGAALLVLAWGAGWVESPERISREIATFTAVFPHPLRTAVVDRIPCPPLRHLRIYVVCTSDCQDVWKIVAVRGLRADTLASLNRLPPEGLEDRRARIAEAVARERLRLDEETAREMIACYMSLEGLRPDLILTEPQFRRLQEAERDLDAMRRLAESLEDPGAADRIEIGREGGGFGARFLYWHTALADRPVLEVTIRVEENGVLRALETGAPVFTAGGG